jgi:hypothetical protein
MCTARHVDGWDRFWSGALASLARSFNRPRPLSRGVPAHRLSEEPVALPAHALEPTPCTLLVSYAAGSEPAVFRKAAREGRRRGKNARASTDTAAQGGARSRPPLDGRAHPRGNAFHSAKPGRGDGSPLVATPERFARRSDALTQCVSSPALLHSPRISHCSRHLRAA